MPRRSILSFSDFSPARYVAGEKRAGERGFCCSDYNWIHVTPSNVYVFLLGDMSLVKGGSGKVVNSKPDDRIFIFFAGHGGPGSLAMPNTARILAADLLNVLWKKHLQGSYKSASHSEESSYGAYHNFVDPPSLVIKFAWEIDLV
ncbi:vacuolar-processing enzyme [Tanacetum coccineum]